MKDSKIRKLVMAALLAALTNVATTVIKIPTPTGGYVLRPRHARHQVP